MVFPNDIVSDLPPEPDPSDGSPPLNDGGDNAANDQPIDGGTGNGEDVSLPEPSPSDGSPPLNDGSLEQPPEDINLPPGAPGGPEGPPAPPIDGIPPEDITIPPGIPGGPEGPPAPIPPTGSQTSSGLSPVPPPPNAALPGIQGILDWLHNAIQGVEDQLGTITSNISDSIGAIIESVIPPSIAAITGMASIIGNLVEGLLNNLAPVADVGQMAQDALTGGLPLALQGFIESAWQDRGDSIPQLLEEIVSNDQLPDSIKTIFANISHGTSLVEQLLGILGLASLLGGAGHALIGPVIERANQGGQIKWRPAVLSEGAALDLLQKGLIDGELFTDQMARRGYADNLIQSLATGTEVPFPLEGVQDARNRGMLTDEKYFGMLGFQGFNADQNIILDQIRWQVPTYTDLVHFMTRDAFWDTPDSPFGDIVHEFQLNFGEEELPFDKFAQAGVPEDMARFAWRAHWEIPGRHDANEMFFRGQLGDRSPGGEGESVLRRVYRARGIEPRFIEPLVATAFHPIGRIDIRRLVKLGQMDRDGAIESYQQLGYNPANAALLADLAIQLATQESASEREPYRAGLKQRLVAAYINGTLSANDTQTALLDLGYDQAPTEAFITEAEIERQAQLQGHIRSGVQRLYTSGEWDKDTATGYLQSKEFQDTEIERLFEWWEPLRELSDLKAEHKSHKEATRADILTAYRDDVIDNGSASEHLSSLGYNDSDIAMFISSIDFAKARSDITTEIEGVHAAFTDRQIDIQEALHELDALNVNGNRRNALLRKWEAELDRKMPDLPLTMVEKLATAKLYTVDELTNELARRHFDRDQIDKFRKLWGYEIAVTEEKNKTISQREADAIKRRDEADKRRQEAEARRVIAHNEAEIRHAEAEARRHTSDARREEATRRREARAAQAEHDRMVRDARSGRLAIGRIRTAYTLGIISEIQAENLMLALDLRPETIQLEMGILNEQLRAKQLEATGAGNFQGSATTAATTPA